MSNTIRAIAAQERERTIGVGAYRGISLQPRRGPIYLDIIKDVAPPLLRAGEGIYSSKGQSLML